MLRNHLNQFRWCQGYVLPIVLIILSLLSGVLAMDLTRLLQHSQLTRLKFQKLQAELLMKQVGQQWLDQITIPADCGDNCDWPEFSESTVVMLLHSEFEIQGRFFSCGDVEVSCPTDRMLGELRLSGILKSSGFRVGHFEPTWYRRLWVYETQPIGPETGSGFSPG